MRGRTKTVCILWGPFGHRLDELAQAVGGERVSLTVLYGPRFFAPLRYVALFLWTLIVLFSRKPDVIIAQNPPIFCPLTSLIYSRAKSRRLIVDHHAVWRSKTLGGPVGVLIGFLESFVASAAYSNTAPHFAWARELKKMGARRLFVVHDFVARNPYRRDEAVRRRYSKGLHLAIASHGGHPLERLESEVSAVSKFADLSLVITGPEPKLKRRLKSLTLPPNVVYAGLLPMSDYLRLKASCDFALNITDEPNTLSHVLFEYAASSLPVISTRSGVVESVFKDSLLYTDSTPLSVSNAITKLLSDGVLQEYRRRITELYSELEARHIRETSMLNSIVAGRQI